MLMFDTNGIETNVRISSQYEGIYVFNIPGRVLKTNLWMKLATWIPGPSFL